MASSVKAERGASGASGASDKVAFCFFLEDIVACKVSEDEKDGGAGGVFVSCGLSVSSVWPLGTSAFAKVGAIVPSWSARAMSSSSWWEDLSDVLVSGFIGG